ncbi:hypothetical protein [Lentzea atacamensis]|uniref:hypothetical protein n=1 Tax=Lentzea atacamensis TaxID=531938 RepID=UPI002D76BFE3|nr:hypothetical protein [Lentzea atacamensis]
MNTSNVPNSVKVIGSYQLISPSPEPMTSPPVTICHTMTAPVAAPRRISTSTPAPSPPISQRMPRYCSARLPE